MSRITVIKYRKVKIKITVTEAEARALEASLWHVRHLPDISTGPESGFGLLTRIENALKAALAESARSDPGTGITTAKR
jgi:hypothetical protein